MILLVWELLRSNLELMVIIRKKIYQNIFPKEFEP